MARLVTIRRGRKTKHTEETSRLYSLPRNTNAKILISRKLGGIGDVVMTTPAIRGLREKYPNAHITYAVSNKWSGNRPVLLELLKGNPYINELVSITPNTYPELSELKNRHDVYVDITGQELKYEYRGMSRHRIDLFCERLRVAPHSKLPDLFLTKEEKDFAKQWLIKNNINKAPIGIQAKSYGAVRNWPVERFKQLANRIVKELNRDVVVFSDTPGDSYLNMDRVYNWCNGEIRKGAALISKCAMLIGVDSGLLHVAGAVRTPILGLFGSVPPMSRLGYYIEADWCWHTEFPCIGCYYKHDCPPHEGPYKPCMLAISVDEVFNKVNLKLAQHDITRTLIVKQKPPVITDIKVKNNNTTKKNILVAMLTFNGLEYTKAALSSIKSYKNEIDILVVDNFSNDGTYEYLNKKGIKTIRKETSVAGACNIAIQEFMSKNYDYLFILNNDIILSDYYIDTLVDEYSKLPNCAFLTGITFNVSNDVKRIFESLVAKRKTEEIRGPFYTGEFSAFCIDRNTVKNVGMFDEIFTPRYVEDDDFAHRVRLCGYKMYRTGKTTFIHRVGKTVSEVVPTSDKKWRHDYKYNLTKYIEKWGDGSANLPTTNEGRALMAQGYKPSGGIYKIPYNDNKDRRADSSKYEYNSYPKNILIIQPEQMGDIILALPIAFELKRQYPNTKITWAINDRFKAFIKNAVTYVDNTISCNTPDDINKILNTYKFGSVYDRIYTPNIAHFDSYGFEHGNKDFVTWIQTCGGFPRLNKRRPTFNLTKETIEYADKLMSKYKGKTVIGISLHSYSQKPKINYIIFDSILEELKNKYENIKFVYLGASNENYKGNFKEIEKINNNKLEAIPQIIKYFKVLISVNSGNLWIGTGIDRNIYGKPLALINISASIALCEAQRSLSSYLERHMLRKVNFDGIEYLDLYDNQIELNTVCDYINKVMITYYD